MKKIIIVLILGTVLHFCATRPEEAVTTKDAQQKTTVIFRAQTPKEAFDYILYVSKKLAWYNKVGFKSVLPQHKAFATLYSAGQVNKEEETSLRHIFYTEIYRVEDFTAGLQTIEKITPVIDSILERLRTLNKNWNFKLLPKYEVVLTLYGPGGNSSFKDNDNTGLLICRTDSKGTFQRNPIEQYIRAIIRLGIYKNITRTFKLTYEEHERLIDSICSRYCADLAPNYWMLPITDIHTFISKEEIEKSLPLAVEKFIEYNPRTY